MKISYNWLKDIIDTNLSLTEIEKILTNTGLEVESIEEFNSIKGGLEGVVVGHVLERIKHPNADKLSVCQVDIGNNQVKQIVCGAPNVEAGQKVLVALVGSTVHPTNAEPFKINKAKIRGEVSEGMICAEDELSLGKSHDGILVLPEHYTVGEPAIKYFENYHDHLIEIGLTANRGDAASHLGVARDIKAVTGTPIILEEIILPEPTAPFLNIDVEVNDFEGCQRYSGLSICGITVQESPNWLKNYLQTIGINPINNIVDATNYVLHTLGQPLHAFDADKIAGNKIIVAKQPANSTFTTLDKIERKLTGIETMICDTEKPLALAGIFGGLHSGITETTTNIFIESAYFNAANTRKTAKTHGLNTDASFRYERGTDPNMTIYALKKVAKLILEIAGGKISSQIIDIYPNKIEDKKITFSLSKNNKIIGKELTELEVKNILNRLEIIVIKQDGDFLHLTIPAYRVDVEREIDVTEEILRIYGLNNIEMGYAIKSAMSFSKHEFGLNLKNKIANFLASNQFTEIATNTLTKANYYSQEELALSVKLLNPLSTDLEIMRLNMLPSVLEAIQYNNNRKQPNLRFFEFGKTYHLHGNKNQLNNYTESKHLVLAMFGSKQPESWNSIEKSVDFYALKQTLENILAKCGLNNFTYLFEPNDNFETSAQLIVNKTNIAQIGLLNNQTLKNFDIEKPVWYADLNFDALINLAESTKFKLKPVGVFPAVRRDLALLLDQSVTYNQLRSLALKAEPNLLKEINAFDVYQGDKIESGKKSYALSFILQNDQKTLTDIEIEEVIQKLIKTFEKEIGATLR